MFKLVAILLLFFAGAWVMHLSVGTLQGQLLNSASVVSLLQQGMSSLGDSYVNASKEITGDLSEVAHLRMLDPDSLAAKEKSTIGWQLGKAAVGLYDQIDALNKSSKPHIEAMKHDIYVALKGHEPGESNPEADQRFFEHVNNVGQQSWRMMEWVHNVGKQVDEWMRARE